MDILSVADYDNGALFVQNGKLWFRVRVMAGLVVDIRHRRV